MARLPSVSSGSLGEHYLASGTGLMVGLTSSTASSSGALTSPSGPQGDESPCLWVMFSQGSKFVTLSPRGILLLLNLGQQKWKPCLAPSPMDSSKLRHPFHGVVAAGRRDVTVHTSWSHPQLCRKPPGRRSLFYSCVYVALAPRTAA